MKSNKVTLGLIAYKAAWLLENEQYLWPRDLAEHLAELKSLIESIK